MAGTLFRIEDVFTIRGRGVIVVGEWVAPEAKRHIKAGDPITVIRADGTRLRTIIRELLMMLPPSGDQIAILLDPQIGRKDVAAGDEIAWDEPGDGRAKPNAPVRVDGSGDPG